MDPASKVAKRRTLAAHLKESIDVLESKVSLFDPLLLFGVHDLLP